MKRNNIKIKGHIGTWYIVATHQTLIGEVHLLEHEEYGEEAPWLCINSKGELILDNIWNGIEDVHEYLEEVSFEREVK